MCSLANIIDQEHSLGEKQINFFEQLERSDGKVCHTCHCGFGLISLCLCKNVVCEACQTWRTSKVRMLNLNKNKRTKKKQRYVLEYMKMGTSNCNICNRVIGYRL